MDQTDEGLIRRAHAAAARQSVKLRADLMQPGATEVAEVNGRRYVVLCNERGIFAVYRVRKPDGILKGLKRWPKELDQQFDPYYQPAAGEVAA